MYIYNLVFFSTFFYNLFLNTPLFLTKASTPIMERSPQNVTVLDGKDATIICRAVGAPTPNITWIYNGKLTSISLSCTFCLLFFHFQIQLNGTQSIKLLSVIFYCYFASTIMCKWTFLSENKHSFKKCEQ